MLSQKNIWKKAAPLLLIKIVEEVGEGGTSYSKGWETCCLLKKTLDKGKTEDAKFLRSTNTVWGRSLLTQ